MYLFLETLKLLKSAIHAVLLDEGFDVPSTLHQHRKPLKQQNVFLGGVKMLKT